MKFIKATVIDKTEAVKYINTAHIVSFGAYQSTETPDANTLMYLSDKGAVLLKETVGQIAVLIQHS